MFMYHNNAATLRIHRADSASEAANIFSPVCLFIVTLQQFLLYLFLGGFGKVLINKHPPRGERKYSICVPRARLPSWELFSCSPGRHFVFLLYIRKLTSKVRNHFFHKSPEHVIGCHPGRSEIIQVV